MVHSWWSPVALLVACLVGCGGGAKRTAPTGPDADADAPECDPGRCLDDLAQRIEPHRAEARACYDSGRERDPDLEGRVIINYEIDGSGTVVDAGQGIQGEQIEDPEVVECLIEVLKTVQFAESAAGRSTKAFHRFEFSR